MERSFQNSGPSETRQRVLDAAGELFATRGFAGTSISAIRRASGVLPSSMYWEFGSKEGILAAVLEVSAARWHDQADESARRALDISRRTGQPPLHAYFTSLAEELTERPDFLRLLLLLALERREADPRTIESVRRVRARAVASLARAFRIAGLVDDGVSDEALQDIARMVLAFADGAFVAAQIDPGTADLRRMFSVFSHGLTAALRVEGAGTFDAAATTHPSATRQVS